MPDPESDIVLELADEFLERYRRGERPALREYIDRHPELAAEIKEVFPAMAMMENIAVADSSIEDKSLESGDRGQGDRELRQLGDYRIIRKIAHGGMGVVYEAEQVSLGRHVALKVLPNQALQDSKTRKRFEREAKAAARLHHTNIVPVFGVGEDDGLPYYVMQFIQGMGLNAVIAELRRLQPGANPLSGASTIAFSRESGRDASAVHVARSLMTGVFPASDVKDAAANPSGQPASDATSDRVATAAPPEPVSVPSGVGSKSAADSSAITATSIVLQQPPGQTQSTAAAEQAYWRSVARIGRQAADALAYAHNQGILHRDVKPSNLLLDLRGTVWVTDFGLAKVAGPGAADADNITHTGDILGTLRYMPPEAFEGRSDARSDVYSLGLTLYEMLALRPAFGEKDRHKLIKDVTTTAPLSLDKVNRSIPRDLATIIHKAIDREPGRRYQSAQEFEADLQRFLDDEPIKARRISKVERLRRWARHNRGLAAALSVIAVLLAATAVVSSLGVVWLTAAKDREHRANMTAQAARLLAEQREDESHAQRDVARDHLYLANMNLAQREWEAGNVAHVHKLLQDWVPRDSSDRDRRGWEWQYQDRLCHGELRVCRGHEKWITNVACSPDGKHVASAGDDGTVRIWEIATGRCLLVLRGHHGRVRAVTFNPDGSRLYSGGEDGAIRGWTIDGDPCLLLQHKDQVTCLALSRDGLRLATAGRHSILRVWDLAQAKEIWSTDCQQGDVNGIAISPDGARIATVGDNGTLLLSDMASSKRLGSINVLAGEARCVAFSPNGALLAAAGQHGSVRIWPASGEGEPRPIRMATDWTYSLAFHPTLGQLATGGDDGIVRLWNLDSGRELRHYQGHTDWIRSVAFNPNGTRLVSAGLDGTLRIWNALGDRTPLRLGCSAETVFSLAFSPDGQQLMSGWEDGKVRIWRPLASSTPVRELIHGGFVEWAAFSPDGTRVASAGRDDIIRIWDNATGQELHALKGHRGDVNCAAFSPDGKVLASAGDRGEAFLWDVDRGERIGTIQREGSELRRIAFHPDGTRLFTIGLDGAVRVWDVAARRELLNLQGHQRAVMGLAVNPDGSRLATAGEDSTARIWDTVTGRELHVLQGHRGMLRAVTFNPDGTRLATGGDDGTVRVWDAASGGELRVLRGHTNWVRSVAFSPDGSWLASAGSDGVIEIVDARPWTPAIGAYEEAQGLVDGLFAMGLEKSDVHARIENHPGISVGVRRLALELAERHVPPPKRPKDQR